jgi:hypothetical protein
MVKMKRKITTLKIMLLSMVLALVYSCSPEHQKRRYHVNIWAESSDWNGWTISCDSFNMKSRTEVEIWVDGVKSTVIADKIVPCSN